MFEGPQCAWSLLYSQLRWTDRNKAIRGPLPRSLDLTRYEIFAGRSSQATLLGRDDTTVESLYFSPALVARLKAGVSWNKNHVCYPQKETTPYEAFASADARVGTTYVNRFSADQSVVETALSKLFGTFPKNTEYDEVLLKVIALNSLYATGILATSAVAQNIYLRNIDDKLEQQSLELVEIIALVTIKGKTRRNYSFASKYCAWHLPEIYPIYDSYVDRLLWAYQEQHTFSDFGRYDLWSSYPQFVKTVNDFMGRFGLQQFTLKQIDGFLWIYGKEYLAPTI